MGQAHVATSQIPVVQVRSVDGPAPAADDSRHSGVVRPCHSSVKARAAHLRQGPIRHLHPHRPGQPTAAQLCSSTAGRRGGNSHKPSHPDSSQNPPPVGRAPAERPVPLRNAGLENGQPLGRSAEVGLRAVCEGDAHRGGSGLAHPTEGAPGGPLHAVEVGSGDRRAHGENCVPLRTAEALPLPHGDHHRGADGEVAPHARDDLILGAQHQERGSDPSPVVAGGEKAREPLPHFRAGEAQGGGCAVAHHHQVRRGPSRSGESNRHAGRDEMAVMVDKFARKQHRITKRSQHTRLPCTDEERASPLHAVNVSPLVLSRVKGMMRPAILDRFNEVWQAAFYPTELSGEASAHPSRLSAEHAAVLQDTGIAVRADGPGVCCNIPFTVVEEKPTGLRQRFILWTREANDVLDAAGYEAQVPLGHVSRYLSAVEKECGSVRDLRCGFFQVEIPTESRRYFRYTDDNGVWWELTRLPMGHSCAPELMHTITAVIGGDPAYVQEKHVAQGVTVHTWIDGVRLCGSRDDVVAATKRMDSRASSCGITWKPEDSVTASESYVFIGVDFKHTSSSVTPSPKLLDKIFSLELSVASASSLESLAGRLLHATAIAGVFPGKFWFTVKFLRRISNALNAGRRLPSDSIVIPASVRKELASWRSAVCMPRVFKPPSPHSSLAVFIDASLKGWGGVIVDRRSNEMTIVGASWDSQESELHINVLEALALRNTIAALPDSAAGGKVDIWVDNTSVVGVARKKICTASKILNDAVVHALARLEHLWCTISLQWISTKLNPADKPSRVPPSSLSSPNLMFEVQRAVRLFFTGVGADSTSSA